jgi:hypothetical protein
MRTIFLALAIATQLPAQVPESTARITRTMPGNGGGASIEFGNTGFKPINAIVIEIQRPGESTVAMSEDFPGQPLEHNGRGTLQTWRDIPTTQMHIAAVIFTDGSSLGYSKPYDNQSDIVTYIFSRRKGQADAWVRWRNFVKSLAGKDARTAVDEFVRAVNAIPVKTVVDRTANVSIEHNMKNDESEGENITLEVIQTQAKNAMRFLSSGEHDARWVREAMLNKYIDGRTNETAKFTQKRIAQ